MKTFRKVSKLLNKALAIWPQVRDSEKGQTLVEYALIIALIVIVTLAVLLSTGTTLKSMFCTINSQVGRASTGS